MIDDPNSNSVMSEAEIAEVRQQLADLRAKNPTLSWSKLAAAVGIPQGTIGPFGLGKYAGDNAAIAVRVKRYLATLQTQSTLQAVVPKVPGYVPTTFAVRLLGMLSWAQAGDIVPIACAPGLGKTMACWQYRREASNVWIVTLRPSCSGLQTFLVATLRAMGVAEPKGTPQQLSNQIMQIMINSGGLLIIDEAHEMSDLAVEEMRSWHDATGIGIALVGDHRVIARIEGRRDKKDRAQIFRRAGMRHVQHQSTAEDANALLDAWGITDEPSRAFARGVALKPGALGSMTKMLKLAGFNAGGIPTLEDLRAARVQLTSSLTEN